MERVMWCLAFVLVAAGAAGSGTVEAQQQRPNLDELGVAIEGYDPVAYFVEGRAREGSPNLVYMHEGSTYRFASAENRELFTKDPERYAPAYGGWCAYAMADGTYAPIDPEAWVIHNDRLYLNFSRRINRRFEDAINSYIENADREWRTLADE